MDDQCGSGCSWDCDDGLRTDMALRRLKQAAVRNGNVPVFNAEAKGEGDRFGVACGS